MPSTRRKRASRKQRSGAAGAKEKELPATRQRVVATTIPELKRSFDQLEHEVPAILRLPEGQRVKRFQAAWQRIFGRPVEAFAAAAYLQLKSKSAGRGTTRKMKQKGGASALAGAPVDFQVRPGIDGAHGSFPSYVGSGLGFYNTINQQAIGKDCGVIDTTPKVPVDIGSNKVQDGGGFSDFLHVITNKPFQTSAPPGPLDDALTAWSGRPLGQSPDPAQTQLRLM